MTANFIAFGVGAAVLVALLVLSRRARWLVRETFRHPFGSLNPHG